MAKSLLGGASYEHNGSFSTGSGTNSSVIVAIGKEGSEVKMQEGCVVQSVNASISLQNRTVYEIGSNKYYQIMGRPSGQGTIQHMVGPNKYSLWQRMGEWTGCKPVYLKVGTRSFKDSCADAHSEKPVKFTGGFLNSVQVSATAGDIVVTSNLGFTFMDIQES